MNDWLVSLLCLNGIILLLQQNQTATVYVKWNTEHKNTRYQSVERSQCRRCVPRPHRCLNTAHTQVWLLPLFFSTCLAQVVLHSISYLAGRRLLKMCEVQNKQLTKNYLWCSRMERKCSNDRVSRVTYQHFHLCLATAIILCLPKVWLLQWIFCFGIIWMQIY